ncbi:hypothetical protein SDC9_80477 [bioreactor metagenome]|uniref:Uncharacterized protein n=1 Tax=bioreactor metagenome TaxID=1076179 RepID=A0A644YZB4_9ZZZZ
MGKKPIGIFIVIAAKFGLYLFVNIGEIFRRNTLFVKSHQHRKHFPVELRLIIFIRFNDSIVDKFRLVLFCTIHIELKNGIGKADQLDSVVESFQKIGSVTSHIGGAGIRFLQCLQQITVFCLVFFTAVDPIHQAAFQPLFLR